VSSSSKAPLRPLQPPATPTPTERPAIDHRVYAGFPTTETAVTPELATPQGRSAAQHPPIVESGTIATDPGQLRRVVFGGSLVVSLVLGAVVVASSLGRSDSDTSGQPGSRAPEAVVEPTTVRSVPTETAATDPVPRRTAPISTPAVAPGSVAPQSSAPESVTPESVAPASSAASNETTIESSVLVAPASTDVPAGTGDLAGEVEESSGVVRNGQIFLTGAVPTVESGERIVALAAAILGPDNVINNYVVDPRASDPNLGNLTVEDTINFASGSTEILSGSETLLNQGLALMTVRPAMTVTIVGHTDSRGTELGNQELSLGRARSVMQWFVDRGISADRFAIEGAGSSQPIADNDTADGRRLNRRIQFFLENILG
jgi:OmpA-OmpF porin, OOP family